MSASLVGSEMCIRDRKEGKQASRQAGRQARKQASKQAGRQACRRASTVSYTHLTLPTICSV
eukprot:7281742-Alexandrium_andersonii.AAC.1